MTIAKYYTPSGRLIQRPYGTDKASYRTEAFAREEQEGENVEHEVEGDTSRSIYKTASGRKVYGGGGITPDYIVKWERQSAFASQLLSKGVFAEYKTWYMDQNGKRLREEYEKDLKRFLSDFQITDEMLHVFEALAKKKAVTIEKDQFEKDKGLITTIIKREIAYTIWGNEGRFKVWHSVDNQFLKALTLFPEAEKIAGLR